MTQNYHPACAPSFVIGILLTTCNGLFLGTYMPSLKNQVRHFTPGPFFFFSSEPVTVKILRAPARNQMRFLYLCQSNLETLLRLLSNVLKSIYKHRKNFKQPNSALQWKI